MTTIRDIQIQSVLEPFSVRIERGQRGGYGYEIGAKCENVEETMIAIRKLRKEIEQELYAQV
jgi:hypothetical protein